MPAAHGRSFAHRPLDVSAVNADEWARCLGTGRRVARPTTPFSLHDTRQSPSEIKRLRPNGFVAGAIPRLARLDVGNKPPVFDPKAKCLLSFRRPSLGYHQIPEMT